MQGTVHCATADGREFRYGAGTGVGGVESLAGKPRWYGAEAETDLVALRGNTDQLMDIFEHQFRMAMDLTKLSGVRVGA